MKKTIYSQEQNAPAQWQAFEQQQQQVYATATVLAVSAVVGAVAAVAGAGMSYYSSQQQASNAEKVANYNATVQQQQAEMQSRMATRQNEINASMITSQQNQAKGFAQDAKAVVDQGQEEIRRKREEQLRFMGTQKAAYAKSGVLLSGSPLAVLADTAGLFELQNQDIAYGAESKSRSLLREGQLRGMGLDVDAGVLALNQSASDAQRRIGVSGAALTRAQGANAAEGYRMQGYGTLLSAAGSVASQAGSYSTSSAQLKRYSAVS